MITISLGDPRDPEATRLLEASHALMQDLFPADDIYALDITELCAPDIRFFVARESGTLLGTGALAIREAYGEVKSLFTAPEGRGRGVGVSLLQRIELEAYQQRLPELKLETGAELAAAMRLYKRYGFVTCGRFGEYAPNGTSIYMSKPVQMPGRHRTSNTPSKISNASQS